MARALKEGRIPFWSSRFGLGIPLVAESHVAAFYPPNLLLYRVFDVRVAYRLSMWLHYVALVATTYAYGRCIGLSAWGSAVAGVSFTLCGFQAIHSSHEPFYCIMPYLPLALSITERYMTGGGVIWLALLALVLGIQWTLGHFQFQMWTGGLVILTALWRAGLCRRLWFRALSVIGATAWGAAIAAVQLGLELAVRRIGTPDKTIDRRPDLLLVSATALVRAGAAAADSRVAARSRRPVLVRSADLGLRGRSLRGNDPARLCLRGNHVSPRQLGPRSCGEFWCRSVSRSPPCPGGGRKATFNLLALPGVGYFRVPARYTLVTSLGLAILAGEGFGPSISRIGFRLGLAGSLVFGACAAAAALSWASRPDVHLSVLWAGLTGGFLWGAFAWVVAIAVVLAWRFKKLPSWAPLVVVSIELGILFYMGTTQWGWAVSLPSQSPVLRELVRRSPAGLIGGLTENLPVRADLATAYPYIGFALPRPNEALKFSQERLIRGDAASALDSQQSAALVRWFKRHRVEYLVVANGPVRSFGTEVGRWRDPALDQVAHRGPTDPAHRAWSIIKLDEPAPEAHVATRARTIAHADELIDRLFRLENPDQAMFLAEDAVPARADASSAKLVSWDGTTAIVDHEGTCDLVIARTFDPGWLARIGDGPEQPVLQVDGGFQAVRVEGSGTHRVTFRYEPPQFRIYAAISLAATVASLCVLVAGLVGRVRSVTRGRDTACHHGLSFSSSAADRFHERGDQPIAEIEPDSGRGEKLGERPRASQRERLLVVGDGPRPVGERSLPDLQGTELGDPVFNVIERIQENVELAMPGMVAGVFVAGPIDRAAEPVEQSSPGGLALVRGYGRGGCRSSAETRRPWRSRARSARSPRAACDWTGRRRPGCKTGQAGAHQEVPWSSRRPRKTRSGFRGKPTAARRGRPACGRHAPLRGARSGRRNRARPRS